MHKSVKYVLTQSVKYVSLDINPAPTITHI